MIALAFLVLSLPPLVQCSEPKKPWGNYDGEGGMYGGHYCSKNGASPPTKWSSTNGYWAGLDWSFTNPAKGVYNFSELDAILQEAEVLDQYVEVNALIGQCSPDWIYQHGVTPLIVNWKPPPTCVPPICVPAGTWDCGAGCGCGGTPCNQTFPDYLSPLYFKYLQAWVEATHAHITSLPASLRKRILSVQANAGNTGDGCAWHGRLFPEQREAGFQKIMDQTVFAKWYLKVMQMYIDTYNGSNDTMLLFNAGDNKFWNEQEAVDKMINNSRLARNGYMIKAGSESHEYSISGEMVKYNASRTRLLTQLSGGGYVRTRGETTLGAFMDWRLRPAWAIWALATWNLQFRADTWQHQGTSFQKQPRMLPVLQFFSHYAGARKGADNPGAWAVLRDGLDVSDTYRWDEATYGLGDNGTNLDRCWAIINATAKLQPWHPPKLDAPDNEGCGQHRRKGHGLNDAGWQVYPGNYAQFLTQVKPEQTSVGAWRVGPADEIFGRYGRSASHVSTSMYFKTTEEAFAKHNGPAFARIVYYDRTSSAATWILKYSAKSSCQSVKPVTGKRSGHWVEVQFELSDAELNSHKCQEESDAVLEDFKVNGEPTVFNLVELSKLPFTFSLSPFTDANARELISIV